MLLELMISVLPISTTGRNIGKSSMIREQIKRLTYGRRGITPVVSVILVTAIAVLLAGVTGALVFGLAEETSDPGPQATFVMAAADNDTGTVTLAHGNGDNVDGSRLSLKGAVVGGSNVFDNGTVSAGDSVTVPVGQGDTIDLVWQSEGRRDSYVLNTFDVSEISAVDVVFESSGGKRFGVSEGNSVMVAFDDNGTCNGEYEVQVDKINESFPVTVIEGEVTPPSPCIWDWTLAVAEGATVDMSFYVPVSFTVERIDAG